MLQILDNDHAFGYTGLDASRYSGFKGAYLWVPVDIGDIIRSSILPVIDQFSINRRMLATNCHITVSYSYRAQVPKNLVTQMITGCSSYGLGYAYKPVEVTYWRGNGEGYIVLNVDSQPLSALHAELSYLGVSAHNYPRYEPHITLLRGCGPPDMQLIRCIDQMNRELTAGRQHRLIRNTGSLVLSDIDVWN